MAASRRRGEWRDVRSKLAQYRRGDGTTRAALRSSHGARRSLGRSRSANRASSVNALHETTGGNYWRNPSDARRQTSNDSYGAYSSNGITLYRSSLVGSPDG